MHIRIEAGRISTAKFFEKRLFVATASDVLANVIGIGQRQHDEVMSLPVAERTRAGSLCLFVLGLAMNDGRR